MVARSSLEFHGPGARAARACRFATTVVPRPAGSAGMSVRDQSETGTGRARARGPSTFSSTAGRSPSSAIPDWRNRSCWAESAGLPTDPPRHRIPSPSPPGMRPPAPVAGAARRPVGRRSAAATSTTTAATATATATACSRPGRGTAAAAGNRDRGQKLDRVGVALRTGRRLRRLTHRAVDLERVAASATPELVTRHEESLGVATEELAGAVRSAEVIHRRQHVLSRRALVG